MSLDNLPEVAFCDTDATAIEQSVITVYEGMAGATLYPGDPIRLFLEALAAVIIQQRNLIDYTGKQNLLKYATGAHLDNLGTLTNTARLPATPALTTIRFSVSAPLGHVVTIPQGSRVSPDGQLIFETTALVEIAAGALYAAAPAQCQTVGAGGNDFLPGQIAKVVDPIPYVASVSNTTTTQGGADIEDDERYRGRIQLAPESFSVAGPALAYSHWAQSAHQDITDVTVYRASGLDALDRAGLDSILGVFGVADSGLTDEETRALVGENVKASVVNVCPLLKGGSIPGQDIIDLVAEKLSDRALRPLTDQVIITAPVAVNYDITATYYILDNDPLTVSAKQAAIMAAVDDFQTWQRSALGRDVNPDQLMALMINAGAYLVDITAPGHTTLSKNQIAVSQTVNVTYGGLVNG
jgi:phage-related baseplate assembly protein